jgi:DNA polymerase-1
VRLFLVDGSAYLFRAYHALPPLTRKSDGLPVGAVQGFCNMLWKLMRDMQGDAPTHLAVIWDHSEKTFRNTLYDKYKAHRPPPPEDLIPQFPLVREATRAFGVPAIELPGYEADDLIAAYACKVRDQGGEAVIVSSDKDLMQLVGDGRVDVRPDEGPAHRPRAGVREVRRLSRAGGRRAVAVRRQRRQRAGRSRASASRPPPS